MLKKLAPFLFILLLAILVFVAKRVFLRDDAPVARNEEVPTAREGRGFARNRKSVEYTKHSLCRMECRQISEQDIKWIMNKGKINYRKSDMRDKPCPTYALEGYTEDSERLRVVFAQCNTTTKVVTCINLDEDFACDCPGDERKKRAVQ